MKHGPTFTVKKLRLLQFLRKKGFTKYKIIPDPTTTKNYNWFIFKNSDALEAAIKEYFSKK